MDNITTIGGAVRMLRTAAGMSMDKLARRANISKAYVGRIELGHNTPTPKVAAALDAALGAGGLLIAAAREDNIMKRRSLLAAISAVAAGAGEFARILDGIDRTPVTRVGVSDVDAVTQSVRFASELDLRYGGGAAAGPGRAVLGWAVQLLDGQMSDTVRVRLSSAVGALADRVAWSHYDAGRDSEARSLYGIALRVSRHGDDANLTAHVLLDESTRAAHARQFEQAAVLLRDVLDSPRLLPAVRANIGLTYARHIAAMGYRSEALDHTSRSLDLIGDIEPAVPDWSQPFLAGPAHLQSVAARPLLFAGDYDAAITGFTTALEQLDASRGRGRAYALALLALAYLRGGYPDQAETTTHTLLTSTHGLKSARVAGHARTLARELRAARHDDLAHDVSKLAVSITPAQD